jgi:hypothetical protein
MMVKAGMIQDIGLSQSEFVIERGDFSELTVSVNGEVRISRKGGNWWTWNTPDEIVETVRRYLQ